MKFSELSKLNTKELKYILKQNKIKNYSNMNKAELLKKMEEIYKQKGGRSVDNKSRPNVPYTTMMSFTSGRTVPKQSNSLNTLISSKNDLEINEKNFIKEYVNLIINQGISSNYDKLSTKYLATISQKKLEQLKVIAKDIFTEIGLMDAKRRRQNLGIE
jgi:hypothetical protein